MIQINNYIQEKLYIDKNFDISGGQMKKGAKLINKQDEVYIVIDFIKCSSNKYDLIDFIRKYDKENLWNDTITKDNKDFIKFNPNKFEYLVAVKQDYRNTNTVFYFGGANKVLKYYA